MRSITTLGFVLLLAAGGIAHAEQVKVKDVNGDIRNKQRLVIITLTAPAPASLHEQILDAANYVVTESTADPDGAVVPATAGPRLDTGHPRFDPTLANSVVLVPISGSGYGAGTVQIKPMKSVSDSLDPVKTAWTWRIGQPYDISSSTPLQASLRFQKSTPVLGFSWGYTTNFHWEVDSAGKPTGVHRDWFNLEGSIPLASPTDVENATNGEDDASERVADFVQGSFSRRWYNGRTISSLGAMIRTSGRFNGQELVIRYQPLAGFWAKGNGFYGIEAEAGYRDRNNEWKNLSQRISDRGNVVGRVGGVLEWAPRLGPINRDLGSGLRFFVRGRGWTDYFENASGRGSVRFRGFADTELFYNVSKDYRVFARYEYGYLPPDLGRRTSSFFGGVGTSF